MGKDSVYYKDKKRNQMMKLRKLIADLPQCAVDYIYAKQVTTQNSTLVSYSYDLITFFKFLKEKNPCFQNIEIKNIKLDALANLSSEDIVEYQRYLELNDESDGEKHENGKKSIARKMSPLRGMFQYHYEHGYIDHNPMTLVPLPRLKKDKNIVRMNQTEVQDILDVIEFGNATMSDRQRKYCEKTKLRDLAILTLMLGTGIRVSECAGLDLIDADLKADTITIVRKGGGQDILYLSQETSDALSDYIENERSLRNPVTGHEQALFLSMQGKRISVDAIENLVKKYGKIAVPNKKITPHKLRSTYGTALYRETGDIRLVADVLGHENINTTIEYYAAIEDEHKRIAAKAVSLRKNKNDN